MNGSANRNFIPLVFIYIEQLPIKPITTKEEKSFTWRSCYSCHENARNKKQIATAKTEGEKDFLENKCNNLDRQIDNLVYKLYELTEEEIKIVEGG